MEKSDEAFIVTEERGEETEELVGGGRKRQRGRETVVMRGLEFGEKIR